MVPRLKNHRISNLQIAFHIGANCTDDERILRAVLRNADALLQRGVSVPGPSRYRKLIRDAIMALDGTAPPEETREILLDAILDDDKAERLVLSNDNFITIPKRIFDHGVFYPQAEMKVRGLRRLFPKDDMTLFLGLRHPLSFLQDAFRKSEAGSLEAYLGVLQPNELRWRDVVGRVKRAAPHMPLVVWCNEDTPLIWERLLGVLTGVADVQGRASRYPILADILPMQAIDTLEAKRAAMDRTSVAAIECLIAETLESVVSPDALEEEIDLPGVDADMVAECTENYANDLAEIKRMEGVEVILPDI